MKKLSSILMMTLVLTVGASLMSCGDIVVGSSDNPVPNPEPTPTPTPAPTYASDAVRPLTFEATKDGVTVMLKFSDNAKPDYKKVEYSLDEGATWTALSGPAQPILLEKAGDIVMFRGDNPTYNGDARFIVEQAASQARSNTRAGEAISQKALIELYGNLTSLIKNKDFTGAETLIAANEAAFKELFKDAPITNSTHEEDHLFYLTYIALNISVPNAFWGLFENTLITKAPDVKVETVAEGTLVNTFKDCPYLKEATLQIGALAPNVTTEVAMSNMFGGTTGSKAEDGLDIIIDEYGHHDIGTDPRSIPTFDDIMNVSGLSKEVLDNTKVSVVDENGKASEAVPYVHADNLRITMPNTEPLELTVGQKYETFATLLPDRTFNSSIRWQSDNPEIAKLESTISTTNTVIAVSPGTTTIRLSYGQLSASFTVTVKAATVAVESITLDQATLDLETGGTATLKATVKPDNASDKTVVWSTSNDKIATVENGVVTAVAAGTAVITAKAGDKKAECNVTVTDPVTAPSVNVNDPDDYGDGGDPTAASN